MKKSLILSIILIIPLLMTMGLSITKEDMKQEITINETIQEIKYYELTKTYDTQTKDYTQRQKETLEIFNDLNKEVSNDIINKKQIEKYDYSLIKQKDNILYNSKGAVTNIDMSNIKSFKIEDRLIAIEKYNKNYTKQEDYKVSLYVGNHNETYTIYRHEDINASIETIINDGEILFNVISQNGYINYETSKFSVQYASFIPADLDYNDFYSVDLKNIFDPGFWEYANVAFTNPDNSQSVSIQAKRDLTTTTHTNSVFQVSLVPTFIGGVVLDTVILQITSYETDHSQNLLVSVGADQFSTAASDFLPLTITGEIPPNPPTQSTSLPNINLDGNDYQVLNMNNYFNNYNQIEVSFPDSGTSQTVNLITSIGGSSKSFTHSNADIHAYLTAYSTRIDLDIQALDKDYSGTFTIYAINNDGEVSDSMLVTTSEDVPSTDPPNQISTFSGTYSVTGTNTQTLNMNNFFTNYDRITLSFSDTGTSTTQLLDVDVGGTSDSFVNVNGDVEVFLNAYSSRIDVQLKGKNINYLEEFTLTAYNDYGNVVDTFLFEVTETTPIEIDLLDGLVGYWGGSFSGSTAFDVHSTNDGTASNTRVFDTDGKILKGFDFTKGDDYVNVGMKSFGSSFHTSTVSFWIKTSPSTGEEAIIGSFNSGSTDLAYRLTINSDNELQIYTRATNVNRVDGYIDFSDYTNDVWHHVVVVLEWDTNNIDMYVNDDSKTITYINQESPTSSADFDFDLVIGAVNARGTITSFYNGLIDEVAIWDRALSSDEVSTLYDIQKDGFESGSYPFEALSVVDDVVLDNPISNTLLSFTDILTINTNNHFSNHDEIQVIVRPSTDYIVVDELNPFISPDYNIEVNGLSYTITSKNNVLTDENIRVIASNEVSNVEEDFLLSITQFGNKPQIIGSVSDVILDLNDENSILVDNFYSNYETISLEWQDNYNSVSYFVDMVNMESTITYNGDVAYKISFDDTSDLLIKLESFDVIVGSTTINVILENSFGVTEDSFSFFIDEEVIVDPPLQFLSLPSPIIRDTEGDTYSLDIDSYFSNYEEFRIYYDDGTTFQLISNPDVITQTITGDDLPYVNNSDPIVSIDLLLNTYTFTTHSVETEVNFLIQVQKGGDIIADSFDFVIWDGVELIFEIELPDFYVPYNSPFGINIDSYIYNVHDLDYLNIYSDNFGEVIFTAFFGTPQTGVFNSFNLIYDYVLDTDLFDVVGKNSDYTDEFTMSIVDVEGNIASSSFMVYIGDFNPVLVKPLPSINMFFEENYTINLTEYFTNYDELYVEFYDINNLNYVLIEPDTTLNNEWGIFKFYDEILTITSKNAPYSSSNNLRVVATNEYGTLVETTPLTIKKYNFLSELLYPIFPPASELTLGDRLLRVFITLFLVAGLFIYANYETNNQYSQLLISGAVGIGSILIVLFTAVGYIPIWIILMIALGLIGLGIGRARQVLVGQNY